MIGLAHCQYSSPSLETDDATDGILTMLQTDWYHTSFHRAAIIVRYFIQANANPNLQKYKLALALEKHWLGEEY